MSGLRLAIPTGRSHVTIMNLLLKLAPALVILGLAAALVLLSLPAPLYARGGGAEAPAFSDP